MSSTVETSKKGRFIPRDGPDIGSSGNATTVVAGVLSRWSASAYILHPRA